jgi:hypothetical protein
MKPPHSELFELVCSSVPADEYVTLLTHLADIFAETIDTSTVYGFCSRLSRERALRPH